jgi:D-aminoacyl-tRNA deacylase
MITVIQRVQHASVTVQGERISEIEQGLLALIGVGQEDTVDDAVYLANRLPVLRIFADSNDKMNLSLLDIKGEILLVSQFTLLGDIYQGRRPSFTNAAPPQKAIELLAVLKQKLESQGVIVKEGQFGAMMDVELLNDGPVTFVLDSQQRPGK